MEKDLFLEEASGNIVSRGKFKEGCCYYKMKEGYRDLGVRRNYDVKFEVVLQGYESVRDDSEASAIKRAKEQLLTEYEADGYAIKSIKVIKVKKSL